MPAPKHIGITACTLLIGCLLYFFAGVKFIPDSAGPDMGAHVDITQFISEHNRLPVFPQDADILRMSPGGTTRATRPPFAYIVGALTAKLAPESLSNTDAYSLGSALLMALTVVITFLTVTLAFKRLSYGLLAATVMALMPQFSFIASYINDDSGAIFAGSLLTASIVLLVKHPLNTLIVAFVAIACGITIMSKLSAWLMLPFIGVAALLHIKQIGRNFFKYALIFVSLFIVSGGWWPISNMLHYGANDPLMFSVADTLIEQYDDNPDNNRIGFAAQGQTYRSLLLGNYMGFVDNTYQSTVGFLDTLRLPLGPVQYLFYLPIFLVGFLAYFVLLVPRLRYSSSSGQLQDENQQSLILETVLVALLLFQVLMYTRFNLYQDIQEQGKYLLPALPALIYLFISGFDSGLKGISKLVTLLTNSKFNFNKFAVTACTIGVAAAIGMHLQALLLHAVPFYRPEPVQLNIGPFKSMDISNDDAIKNMRGTTLTVENGRWVFNSPRGGGYIVFHPSICENFGPSTLIRVSLHSDHDDQLKFFYNNGLGHVEKHTGKVLFSVGDSTIVYSLKQKHCENLRLDVMRNPGTIIISDIAFATFTHVPKYH